MSKVYTFGKKKRRNRLIIRFRYKWGRSLNSIAKVLRITAKTVDEVCKRWEAGGRPDATEPNKSPQK